MEGIYMIKNKVNDKVYIGESIDIHKRWGGHREELLSGTHNRKLREDMDKYGIDVFEFSVVKEVPQNGMSCYKHNLLLLVYEDYYIRKFNSVNKGYNCQYTLNFVKDGRKRVFDFKINGKQRGKIIDILYGTIKENNGEYSIEKEIEYRKKHGYSEISEKSLLNQKLRNSYKDYSFISCFIELINNSRDRAFEMLIDDESYYGYYSYEYDYESILEKRDRFDKYINLSIEFIKRFSFGIAEYLYVAKYMIDFDLINSREEYGEFLISEYITYEEFKLIKRDILNVYTKEELEDIVYAIRRLSPVLFFKDFEIPSEWVRGLIEENYWDVDSHSPYQNDDYYHRKDPDLYGLEGVIDLFSSKEEMMEYLESF